MRNLVTDVTQFSVDSLLYALAHAIGDKYGFLLKTDD